MRCCPHARDDQPGVHAVRGALRDPGRGRRGPRAAHHRRPRRRDVARLHLPEGRRARRPLRRPRPPAQAGQARRRRFGSRSTGTRRSTSPPTACAACRSATAATPSPPTSATRARTRRRCIAVDAAAQACSARATTTRRRRPTSCPSTARRHEMFGNLALFPIPDIDRTDHMLVLGANPAVSNGSLMTAPGARHRLRGDRRRAAARVVVVDPRRTETVEARHRARRGPARRRPLPAARACSTCSSPRGCRPRLAAERCDGLDALRALAAEWSPERAAPLAGVDAATIARLAREFAAAPSRGRLRPRRRLPAARPARSRTG